MKTLLSALPFVLALACGGAHAQLYKWVGPDGKVTYSDTPPPAAAKAETSPVPVARGGGGTSLPYELGQAARNHPVTLYTTGNCTPCDDGRKLLTERGIPYAEKTVTSNEDIAELRKAGGDGNLPLLTVGRAPQRGFEPGIWNNALTAAGYPASSQLPKSWRNPLPEPAAQKVQTARTADAAAKPAAPAPEPARDTALPPAVGKAPPGFRF